MSRLLMLFAIGAAVYWLLRSYGKEDVSRQDSPAVEDMVRCAHCGLHIPKSEGLQSGGNYFCGAGHRDAYRK